LGDFNKPPTLFGTSMSTSRLATYRKAQLSSWLIGAPPIWPVDGSEDNATALELYAAIVTTALFARAGSC